MKNLLVVASALLAACAGGTVDEPTPTEEAGTEPPPHAGAAPAPDASTASAAKHCERQPKVEQFDLPDGGHLSVVIYAECREAPSRDLGDPPPGPR